MEHFISLSTRNGNNCNLMKRVPLSDALKFVIAHNFPSKHECWLLSNGYKDTNGLYTRSEFNFQFIDTILLDVDNEANDPTLMEQFKKEYDEYAYFLWESASSTPECPKFRVLMPLDGRVEWVNEPAKFTKKAILGLFSKYTDNRASWYFSPTTSKIGTVIGHKGRPFSAWQIESRMNVERRFNEIANHVRQVRDEMRPKREHDPEGWRRFPAVKACLGHPLPPHARHDPLYKACYAMNANGYKEAIPQFLSEVDAPNEHKHQMLVQFK